MRSVRVLVVLLLLALPAAAAAQDADVLTGRVTGTDGRPIAGARVVAMSIETEITRSVVTDKNGRYMIVFPDGGGAYLLRFSFLGLQEALRTVVREAGEELLVMDVALNPQPIELEGITVEASRPPPTEGRSGDQSTDLSLDMLSRLPLPDMDPNTLALLAAGVIGTGLDSLSGRMGFSVAGMSDLLNQVTLDGLALTEGGLQAPELGLRMTNVTTSTFDVSRGGFAGGQVNMSSARGNNRSSVRFQYTLEDDALQVSATPSSNPATNQRIGMSVGGPIVRNRLFYNASFDLSRNVQHRFALTGNQLGETRAGVAADSIARFLDILELGYGFPAQGATGRYNQFQDAFSPQLRVDWNIAQGHTLTTSFNATINDRDSTSIRETDLSQHGGESGSDNWRSQLTLTSRLPGVLTNMVNNFRFSFNENRSDAQPYLQMPEGRVTITSDFADGTRDRNTLVFGGNRSMPTESYGKTLQVSNDLSFMLTPGSQIHRLRVGASLRRQRSLSRSTNNLFGTYWFDSLDDFENNLPYQFERSLAERETRSGSLTTGVYVGDTWRPTNPLEITMGVRWDFSSYDQKPQYNPAVEEAFGRRTDFDPKSTQFSPRLGFNLRLNEQGTPTRAITGGIGLTAGQTPGSIFSQAARQTGLPSAEQSLRCLGDVVPIPDWDLYATGDPSVIPAACADGGPGTPPALSSRAPNITLINPDQRMPASLRAEIGYRTQLPFRVQANFRYAYARGIGLWGYRDINLDESESFVLAGENRRFFGDPSAIVERNGTVSLVSSRLHEEFGNVYDVTSDLASSTHTITSQLSGILPGNIRGSVNYTLQFSRDQGGSGSFQSATTADNPNVREWGTANNDRRHTMNVNLSYPFTEWFEITATGRVSSGQPFTPMVQRDINGDGVANDRAFVFDPAATADTSVAGAMNRLLDNVPGRIRSCLEDQFGSIAARNSCRLGWSQSLDMRISVRPPLPTLGRRLTLQADLRNVLSGLDQLLHGDAVRGWGETQQIERQLLYPRAFDPLTNSFVYEVNEGFGQTRRGQGAIRSVFAIRLQANVSVGGQRDNQGFRAPIAFGGFGGFGGGGRGGRGGGGFNDLGAMGGFFRGGVGTASLDSLLDRTLVNPLKRVLALRDTLALTDEQAARVHVYSDTLAAQLARRRAVLNERAQTLALAGLVPQNAPRDGNQGRGGRGGGQPANPQLAQQLQLEIQPQIDGARREVQEALRQTQQELTPEQWEKIPAAVRNIGQGGGGRGGRGGFNAVGMIDRMLANPIPVLLALEDTLKLSAEQVARIEQISATLEETLIARRAELGRRFDNLGPQEQGQRFREVQPQLEETRRQISDALKLVEKVLTSEQWRQVPEQIRNPFQNQGGRGGRGGRGGDSTGPG